MDVLFFSVPSSRRIYSCVFPHGPSSTRTTLLEVTLQLLSRFWRVNLCMWHLRVRNRLRAVFHKTKEDGLLPLQIRAVGPTAQNAGHGKGHHRVS